jgi:hypothetical protein
MCAQHLTCKCSFDNILVDQSFITFFKYEIVTLLELALSTVTVKSLSMSCHDATANNNEELKRTINCNAMMQQPTTLGKRTQK